MASHEYLGTRDVRAVRKWAKLTRGRPEPVALDRIGRLLRGLPEAPPVGGTAAEMVRQAQPRGSAMGLAFRAALVRARRN